MISALSTTVLAVVSFVIFKIIQWIQRRKEIHSLFEKIGIPGPKPNFLDGNFVELRSGRNSTEKLTEWHKKYGRVFGYYVGSEPFMVIHDVEVLKQVFVKDFSNFVNRSDLYVQSFPINISLIGIKDQNWKDVRSILSHTFSGHKIKLMSKIMNKKVASTVDVVKKYADRREDMNMYEVAKNLTLDVISECALAMNVDSQHNSEEPLKKALQQAIDNYHNKILELSVMFPVLLHVMNFGLRFTTYGKMMMLIIKNLKKAIDYRRRQPETRKVDLLQIMIDSVDSNEENSKARLTDGDVIANAVLFLGAGYETTSTALGFTFWLLVQHPDVQEKVYEEVLEHCKDEELSYESVQNLQYLEQVFSESMRLYPPVTTFLTRVAQKECTFENITIPKGVTVMAPIWDIHYNPELWPEPTEFDPDRFAPENKSRIHSMAYMPFGAGPRYCMGTRFAQLEAKLAIGQLVRKYKFVPCERTEKKLTIISPMVNINPANGIYLKAVPR